MFDGNGNIFFTVQGADMVGRLNMATGETKSVPVPTPKANPYGMVVTTKHVPYFVEFGANKIASIDPETLEIHEYMLPDEKSPSAARGDHVRRRSLLRRLRRAAIWASLTPRQTVREGMAIPERAKVEAVRDHVGE